MARPEKSRFSARRGWPAAFGLLLASAGCGGDGGGSPFVPLPPDPSFPGTPGDPAARAGLFQFQPIPGCAVSNPTNLGAKTPLRIFRGPGVTDASLAEVLGGLQRYYTQYGVTFSTAYDVIVVPLTVALILDMNQLTARVREMTGIDINRTNPDTLPIADQDRVLAALGTGIMHNVSELLRVYSMPRVADINVVVLSDMVTMNLAPGLEDFAGLVGLGVSPELLATIPANDPAQMLYSWLHVTGEFTPTAIVGVRAIRRFLPTPDIVIAHEVGHAYGLAHVTDVGNLLNPGDPSCAPVLSDAQLARVREATAAFAHEITLEHLSLTSRASEFVVAVRSLLYTLGR